MRHLIWLMAFCVLAASTPLWAQGAEKAGRLTVVVTGLRNGDGKIRVALSDSKTNFEAKGSEPFRRIVVGITGLTSEVVLEGLPFGEYAIKVVHDENDNGRLDTNFLGIPKEDFAFSNNAAKWLGPDYEKAKFPFTENRTVMIPMSR